MGFSLFAMRRDRCMTLTHLHNSIDYISHLGSLCNITTWLMEVHTAAKHHESWSAWCIPMWLILPSSIFKQNCCTFEELYNVFLLHFSRCVSSCLQSVVVVTLWHTRHFLPSSKILYLLYLMLHHSPPIAKDSVSLGDDDEPIQQVLKHSRINK